MQGALVGSDWVSHLQIQTVNTNEKVVSEFSYLVMTPGTFGPFKASLLYALIPGVAVSFSKSLPCPF